MPNVCFFFCLFFFCFLILIVDFREEDIVMLPIKVHVHTCSITRTGHGGHIFDESNFIEGRPMIISSNSFFF